MLGSVAGIYYSLFCLVVKFVLSRANQSIGKVGLLLLFVEMPSLGIAALLEGAL